MFKKRTNSIIYCLSPAEQSTKCPGTNYSVTDLHSKDNKSNFNPIISAKHLIRNDIDVYGYTVMLYMYVSVCCVSQAPSAQCGIYNWHQHDPISIHSRYFIIWTSQSHAAFPYSSYSGYIIFSLIIHKNVCPFTIHSQTWPYIVRVPICIPICMRWELSIIYILQYTCIGDEGKTYIELAPLFSVAFAYLS